MSLTPAERRLVEILARIAYRRLREKQALADVAARGDRPSPLQGQAGELYSAERDSPSED